MKNIPFALSLSKGRPFFQPCRKEDRCFDRLSTNGNERAPGFVRLCSALIAAVLFVSLPASPVSAQSFPKLTGRVVDQAEIIPADREAALNTQLEQIEKTTGHQLVVATVNSLEGHDVADYGYKLGRAWGIGGKEANDGVVFLIAPNERRMNISVGYGLEPVLTDALSGRIIRDQVTPKFREDDYPGGIQAGVDAIAEQIQLPPEEAAARAAAADSAERDRADDGDIGGLIFIGFIIFFFFILPMLTAFGRRGKRHRRHRPWGGAPIIIWGDDDWGGGGGSSWGGGSWGGGGGGGFGGFSGGGGSFGGGGASGGW